MSTRAQQILAIVTAVCGVGIVVFAALHTPPNWWRVIFGLFLAGSSIAAFVRLRQAPRQVSDARTVDRTVEPSS